MGEAVPALTQATFDAAMKTGRPLLVDFTAPWCPPCRMLAPQVEAIANDYAGRLDVCKVDTDREPGLSERFGVMSLPTLLLIKDEAVVGQLVGAVPRARIEALIAEAL